MNRPVHFEILANEPEKLGSFYERVFGWKLASFGDDEQAQQAEQGYWLITTGARDEPGIDGGMMHRHFDQAVINTIAVEDLSATVRAIEGAGGRRLTDPQDIPGVGTHAYCADPEENLFGVLQPAM